MGMFDTIIGICPECGSENEFQTKSGDCNLCVFNLNDVDEDTLEDVNRHNPSNCIGCDKIITVDIENRKVIIK